MDTKRREVFNRMAHEWEAEFADTDKATLMRRVMSPLPLDTASVILDLGCGAGKLLPILHERATPSSRILAIDYAEEMMHILARRHRFSNVVPIVGDVTRLPLSNGTVDCAVLLALFAHLPDKRTGLRELRRVVRPGGSILIVHLAGKETIHRIHNEKGGPLAGDLLPSGSELENMLHEEGFSPQEIIDKDDLYVARAERTR